MGNVPPIRKARLAAAYLALGLFGLPGILVFFFVKDILPPELTHPSSFVGLAFVGRLLIQLTVSVAVLLPSFFAYFRLMSRFLSEDELARFRKGLDE